LSRKPDGKFTAKYAKGAKFTRRGGNGNGEEGETADERHRT
jgi:hypothetical protein